MKTRSLTATFTAALAAALILAALPLRDARAQNATDAKIRLMAEALRARDAGDLAGAQRALAQLSSVAPEDKAVQRLRAEIETQAVAQQAANARQAAAEKAVAAKGAQPMVDVRIPETAPAAATPAPSGPAPEQEAEAIARAEAARQTEVIAAGRQQLAAARDQLRGGRYDDAIVTIDAAVAGLPVNGATQVLIADLKKEKAAALLDRALAAFKANDLAGARAALTAHDQIAPASSRSSSLERQIARAGSDVTFAADRAATAQLIAKGRAQYVAGDVDGAQETFRSIEAQEPDNTVAKGFLLRIAEEKTETGALNRQKTRAQMLEEVAKSWQRPGIYQERAREADPAATVAPLARKLGEIVLPAVSWTRAPIGDVVAALSAISEEYDRTGEGNKGVNIVLIDPSGKTPQVSLTLRNTTLKRVLDFVTEGIGYQYEVQADAVVVRPGGETSTLETQF
ncbi:MAG: hypothetical protein ACKOE8_16650, partial [Opitutaceae bacterium]